MDRRQQFTINCAYASKCTFKNLYWKNYISAQWKNGGYLDTQTYVDNFDMSSYEKFELVEAQSIVPVAEDEGFEADATYIIKSAHGANICIGSDDNLWMRRDGLTPNDCEITIKSMGDNKYALKSSHSEKYVHVPSTRPNVWVRVSNSVNDSEKFTITCGDNKCQFRSVGGRNYLRADLRYPILRTYYYIHNWESFTLTLVQ